MWMLIGQNIRNANTYMTLSPTSWQLVSEANEQEAHALTAELVHNIFVGFAVLFLTNTFSHSMFCKDSFCSVCSICGGMLLPTFNSFVLNTCHPTSSTPQISLLSLSPSLSAFLSLCLYTYLPLGRPFLFTPNWLFLQPCTISLLFTLESFSCCPV